MGRPKCKVPKKNTTKGAKNWSISVRFMPKQHQNVIFLQKKLHIFVVKSQKKHTFATEKFDNLSKNGKHSLFIYPFFLKALHAAYLCITTIWPQRCVAKHLHTH